MIRYLTTISSIPALLFLLQSCQRYLNNHTTAFVDKFNRFNTKGDLLGFWADNEFRSLDSTMELNHFQGIQRLKDTNYLFLTSNTHKNESLLHVVRLSSKSMIGKFGSNLNSDFTPPEEDRIVLNYVISHEYNHAGGIQIIDDVLVVPLENGVDSKILFFDINEPEQPKKLHTEIFRQNKSAGAVGIYKETAQKEFLVLFVKADDLDIYYSTSDDLADTHFELKHTLQDGNLRSNIDSGARIENYQNINLINLNNGFVYLLGLYNNTNRLFRMFSKDYADLFQYQFDSKKQPMLKKVARKNFECQKNLWSKRSCDFDAGAGIYYDGQDRLLIYAVDNKPENRITTLIEYSAPEKR